MLVNIVQATKALCDAFQVFWDGHTSFLGCVRTKWGGDTFAFWETIGYMWQCVSVVIINTHKIHIASLVMCLDQ